MDQTKKHSLQEVATTQQKPGVMYLLLYSSLRDGWDFLLTSLLEHELVDAGAVNLWCCYSLCHPAAHKAVILVPVHQFL